MSRGITGPENIGRREFTVESILALLAGVTITISGCGSTSTPASPSPPAAGTPGDVTGAVSANHGHVAIVTGAQITAGNAVALNIQGTATHSHTVNLTADQVRAIGARQQVAVSSTSEDAHTHMVTFN